MKKSQEKLYLLSAAKVLRGDFLQVFKDRQRNHPAYIFPKFSCVSIVLVRKATYTSIGTHSVENR